jgi:hypothetical protein
MLQFKTIQDGCNYHTHCPLCQNAMTMNQYDATINITYDFLMKKKTTLSWNNVAISIDIHLEDNSIERMVNYSQFSTIYVMNGSAIHNHTGNYQLYSGVLWERLGFNCLSCGQYGYLLRIKIDTNDNSITTYLNSEFLAIQEESRLHEINNSYVSETTQYSVFGHKSSKLRGETPIQPSVQLPLIELDFIHPDKTLARVKQLTIFS